MKSYKYNSKGKDTKSFIFTEAGFSIENYNCYYCDNTMLYFTKISITAMIERGNIVEL